MSRNFSTVYGTNLTIDEYGSGDPILLLHSEEGPQSASALAELLGEDHHVLVPHHPGYGDSPKLPWRASIRDLAYVYSELINTEGWRDLAVIGSGIGGWTALELAALGGDKIDSLVLLGPVGIKLSGIEERDFVDIHAISTETRAQLGYHNPKLGLLDTEVLELSEIEQVMQARETFTNYVWEPYLHSKELHHHSARIRSRTLILSGAADELVRSSYYADLAGFLPNATHVVVPDAGHFVDLERPDAAAKEFRGFTVKSHFSN